MKNKIGISHFFKNNTPKFWQILGDISLFLAAISGAILSIPEILSANGIENFVMPVYLLTTAKWCTAIGAIIKFITKFFGEISNTPEQK